MKKLFLLTVALFLVNTHAIAQTYAVHSLPEIPLWPDKMPDASGSRGPEVNNQGSLTHISTPRLIVHRPETPKGVAVLIISGGGYAHIETGKESGPAAEWLVSKGITAFELIYRLPQKGWKTPYVPFEDGQRALRMIRSHAAEYAVDPHKIGILGFSAGGHLAGMMASVPDKVFYKPVDAVDGISAKPDFAGLIYPVISMLPPNDTTHSQKSILGKHPSMAEESEFSVEKQVKAGMPPVFLAQASDDPIASIDNSLLMFSALRKSGIPAELHIFQQGGHGWGMGKPGTETSSWPDLFQDWMQANGFR